MVKSNLYKASFALLVSSSISIMSFAKSKCPEGFILIEGGSRSNNDERYPDLGPFCVMKYEAKRSESQNSDAAYQPVSKPEGKPWTGITREDAINACKSLDSKSNYSLISLAQWQVIARNIEKSSSNWSTGQAFKGQVNQGHMGTFPAESLAADESDPCFGTGKYCKDGQWSRYKRTHRLPSGSEIWDFSANVWEWISNNIEDELSRSELKKKYLPNDYQLAEDDPMVDSLASHPKTELVSHLFGTSHDYTKPIRSLGTLWLTLDFGYSLIVLEGQDEAQQKPKGGIIRGGSYGSTYDAGIFTTNTYIPINERNEKVGFRCVKLIDGRS